MTALITSGTRILPEWIDYNGHLMDGYYLVAFSDATEGVLEALGFGPAYRERTGCTIYTAEAHLTYLREVSIDTPLSFATQVIDYDAKRIHVVHVMINASGAAPQLAPGERVASAERHAPDERLATAELMFLHVRQSTGKVVPMPSEQAKLVAAMAEAHAGLERPPEVGRRIGMRRDSAGS